MKKEIENTYGKTMQGLLFAVNPLKKKFIKTYCIIHRYINMQAIEMLKNEGHIEEYEFYKKYVKYLNDGVTWADQDFKSSNHFYHYSKGKGLFGFSNALEECKKYYKKAIFYNDPLEAERAVFYFGAACHLIQDSTVPQHVNNKLLKSHRRFELWIISKFMSDYSFFADKGIIRYKKLDDYIINNSLMANNTYLKFMDVRDREERYREISSKIIKEAQRTTAGVMLDFYKELHGKTNI